MLYLYQISNRGGWSMDLVVNSFRATMMGIARNTVKNPILGSAQLVDCCRENKRIQDELIKLFEECLMEVHSKPLES